jgi:hypothetical protein
VLVPAASFSFLFAQAAVATLTCKSGLCQAMRWTLMPSSHTSRSASCRRQSRNGLRVRHLVVARTELTGARWPLEPGASQKMAANQVDGAASLDSGYPAQQGGLALGQAEAIVIRVPNSTIPTTCHVTHAAVCVYPAGVTMQLLTSRPKSRGTIGLKSTNPFDLAKVRYIDWHMQPGQQPACQFLT